MNTLINPLPASLAHRTNAAILLFVHGCSKCASLVGVGNEQAGAGQSCGAFVYTASPPQLLWILYTLFSRESSIEQAVAGELGGAGDLELWQLVCPLGTAAAARAFGSVENTIVTDRVFGDSLGQASSSFWCIGGAPLLPRPHGARGSIWDAATTTGGTTASAAPRPTVVQALHGFVVIAIFALDFGGAEPHGHTADTNVVVLWGVAHNSGLSVMPNLGSHLASTADSGRRPYGTVASVHLHVGPLLGSLLLREHSGVFILCPVAPDGGLLFPQEGDVAVGSAAAGARRGTAAEVGLWRRRAESRRRRIGRDGAEGVHRGRAARVAHARWWLLQVHRRG